MPRSFKKFDLCLCEGLCYTPNDVRAI